MYFESQIVEYLKVNQEAAVNELSDAHDAKVHSS